MWTKRIISFLIILIYFSYLVYLRIFTLFVTPKNNPTVSWIIIHIIIVIIFILLLIFQIFKIKKIQVSKLSNLNVKILKYLDKLYLEANNFINTYPRLDRYLNNISSKFIDFCAKYDNKLYIYLVCFTIPYITIALVFIIEVLLYKALMVFYYCLFLTFITLFFKYIIYRSEQLYLLLARDLTRKSLIQAAFPSDEFYRNVSILGLIEFLSSKTAHGAENIRIIIVPSMDYLKAITDQNKNLKTDAIIKSLNEHFQNLIKFRKTLTDLNNVKLNTQVYVNIFLYLIYIIGWSYLIYLFTQV